MNKEIKFYLTDEGNVGHFISFVRINDNEGKIGEFQIWSGPDDDEQMQACANLSAEEALYILTQAIDLLKE